jgi:hypothetical protein
MAPKKAGGKLLSVEHGDDTLKSACCLFLFDSRRWPGLRFGWQSGCG